MAPERTLDEEQLPPTDRVHDLVSVARMYYEQELSQQEIAVALDRSRPTISRMLAAARRLGIVQIDIRDPLERSLGLEQELENRFGLVAARVLIAASGERDLTDRLGRAGAAHLQSVMRDGTTVGVSNGRTLAAIARYLEPQEGLNVEVTQIIGASSTDDPAIDTPDIARALAAAYQTTPRFLHIPLLVESEEVRDTLIRDRNTSRTLRLAAKADVAVVGVGIVDPADISPIFDGFMTAADLARLARQGAVGHICGEFFDDAGTRLEVDVNERVVGIGLRGLRRIPNVIAVAGGLGKAHAIAAAIRGGYVDTLITDDRAAERILSLPDG